jgi:hypothetical protein
LADPILRVATQADFAREQAQRQKSEASRNQIAADEAHRKELADLFPAAIRPGISGASSNQPGYFNLDFYNVPEQDIRKLAKLLKSFGQIQGRRFLNFLIARSDALERMMTEAGVPYLAVIFISAAPRLG